MKPFLVAFSAMGLLLLASCGHGGGEDSVAPNLVDENQPTETQTSTENAPTQTQRTDSATTTQREEITITESEETSTTQREEVATTTVGSVIQVSVGSGHTCAVLSNKTIKCWGNNRSGQLGDGTDEGSLTPVQVTGITTAIQISAGSDHTCALLENKTIKCWGYNGSGQLGDGTGRSRSLTPVQVLGITNATQVSARVYHTCALLENKTIKCWGSNENGQLGDGTGGGDYDKSITPVQVQGITNATQISAAGGEGYLGVSVYTCALLENKTIKCWGSNDNGQLGDGTGQDSLTPVQVQGITNATQISAGHSHTCSILENKTIKCWGSNESGQLGDGTGGGDDDKNLTPVQVLGITNATQVSAGHSHTCALLENKTIKCWGSNQYGRLGDGTLNKSIIPVQVLEITNATQVSAGDSHTCAILENKTIKCWGRNFYGQLGNGASDKSIIPVQVQGITNAIQVSAGEGHTCALLENNSIKCWGSNESGQLGDGTGGGDYDKNLTPVQVLGITNATQVSARHDHTCALLENKTIKCWGNNIPGQLGDGTATNRLSPVEVQGITNATQVSAGREHTCALLENNTVMCWGDNGFGQLGDGAGGIPYFDNSLTPVQVQGITNAVKVSAGSRHTCALLENKTIKCWGHNWYNQLGDGAGGEFEDKSLTPVQVQGITNATQVSSGGENTCALLENKTIKCWGSNYLGQLGDGTTAHGFSPVEVQGITNAIQILAGDSQIIKSHVGGFDHQILLGGFYTCALLENKTIKCWGNNRYGQLGDGTGGNRDDKSLTPVQVQGITNAVQVSAGFHHTCALLENKTIKCWGSVINGRLGNGGDYYIPTPVEVIELG